jgi:predicted transcriptional regulator
MPSMVMHMHYLVNASAFPITAPWMRLPAGTLRDITAQQLYMALAGLPMNFNIYLDDNTGKQLSQLAKEQGRSRNALIREAVAGMVAHNSQALWPAIVANFNGLESATRFEQFREELREPTADPLT